jgi:hypothetical protein
VAPTKEPTGEPTAAPTYVSALCPSCLRPPPARLTCLLAVPDRGAHGLPHTDADPRAHGRE